MINGKITNCGKIREIFNYYYSPSLVIKQTSEEFENLYCFISRIEPWDNEAIPPVPNDTDYDFCLLVSNKLKTKSLIGYASVKIDEIEDKSERVNE